LRDEERQVLQVVCFGNDDLNVDREQRERDHRATSISRTPLSTASSDEPSREAQWSL